MQLHRRHTKQWKISAGAAHWHSQRKGLLPNGTWDKIWFHFIRFQRFWDFRSMVPLNAYGWRLWTRDAIRDKDEEWCKATSQLEVCGEIDICNLSCNGAHATCQDIYLVVIYKKLSGSSFHWNLVFQTSLTYGCWIENLLLGLRLKRSDGWISYKRMLK